MSFCYTHTIFIVVVCLLLYYRIDPSFKKPGKEKKEGDDENEVKGTDETEEKKVELKDEKEIQAEKKSKFFKKFQKKTYS